MIDIDHLIKKALELIRENPQIMLGSVRNEKSIWKLLSESLLGDSNKFMTVIMFKHYVLILSFYDLIFLI
jgi:hypothetical protein